MGDSPHAVQPAGALARLDHLLVATRDVDATVEDLAGRLGVRAAPGGRHPAWGTRNALISLGRRCYLEILGPDASQPEPAAGPRPAGIDALERARLATWAAASSDLEREIARARRAGVELGEPVEGSRRRADGTLLAWRMTNILAPRLGGLVPFFIDWGSSPHPGEASPPGCTPVALRAEHPQPAAVRRALEALAIEMDVATGPEALLVATLQTPLGRVELR